MTTSKHDMLRTEASLPFAVTFVLLVLIGICSGFSLKAAPAGDRPGEEASSLFVRDRAPADHAVPRPSARNKAVAELRFLSLGKDRKLVSGGSAAVLPVSADSLLRPADGGAHDSAVFEAFTVHAVGHHTRVRAPPEAAA